MKRKYLRQDKKTVFLGLCGWILCDKLLSWRWLVTNAKTCVSDFLDNAKIGRVPHVKNVRSVSSHVALFLHIKLDLFLI